MNIGIDIDDVITDGETYYAYAQKYIVETLQRTPVIVNDLGLCEHASYCDDLFGWSQKESEDFWNKNMENVLSDARIRSFARETISALREKGHKIFIITARHHGEMEIGFKWLEDHNIEYDELYFDIAEKGKFAKEKNIDVFIDDSFINCKSIDENGVASYIMDIRTNRNIDLSKTGIKRIFSWPHFYSEIEKREELR